MNKIKWGAPDVVPDGATAEWGARAIVKGGFVDLLHDRQYADGPDVDRLLALLNAGIIKQIRETITELLMDGTMRHDENEPVIVYDDGPVTVYANTGGSFGYCYIEAWLKEEIS